MHRSARPRRIVGGVGVALLWASVALAQPVVIEVMPKPIGAAAQLVQARGEGALNELPVQGMVPAASEAVGTRGTFASSAVLSVASSNRAMIALEPVSVMTAATLPVDSLRRLDTVAVYEPAVVVGVFDPGSGTGTGTGTGGSPAPGPGTTPGTLPPISPQGLPLPQTGNAEVYSILRQSVENISTLRREREARAEKLAEAERDIRGPTALHAINLLDGLRVDPGVDLSQSQILQIDNNVYGDDNPDTGLFYFLPKRYDLEWTPESQYAMTVIYGLAGNRAEEGQVFMAARLRAGVDARELSVAESLLRAYVRRHSAERLIKLRGLRPTPLQSASEVSLFGGGSNEFTIPEDSISIQGISGLLGTLDVSWATDVRRLLNIESLLRTDAGIHGSLTLHAAGEGKLARAVPLEISVGEAATFGRIPFDRANGWQNSTFYPIRLQRLHALLIAPANLGPVRRDEPVVFTWDLESTRVPPGAVVRWNGLLVPPWVEQQALLAWVTYGVESDCESCDDRVFNERFIPPPPATRRIVFTTGDVFEATGAYRINVQVRSPFLTPQRNRLVEQPSVTLTKDGEETVLGKLFLSEREITGTGADQPLYEFRLEVTMRDGQVYRSPEWQPSRELDLLLGSVALEKMLGQLPTAGGAPEAP